MGGLDKARKRLERMRELLEMDLRDLEGDRDLMETMMAEAPHLIFNKKSPVPGHSRFFPTIDLNIEKYPEARVARQERHRLQLAIGKTGVVAPVGSHWLYLYDGRVAEMRLATRDEVKVLPHLPSDWESHVTEVR